MKFPAKWIPRGDQAREPGPPQEGGADGRAVSLEPGCQGPPEEKRPGRGGGSAQTSGGLRGCPAGKAGRSWREAPGGTPFGAGRAGRPFGAPGDPSPPFPPGETVGHGPPGSGGRRCPPGRGPPGGALTRTVCPNCIKGAARPGPAAPTGPGGAGARPGAGGQRAPRPPCTPPGGEKGGGCRGNLGLGPQGGPGLGYP